MSGDELRLLDRPEGRPRKWRFRPYRATAARTWVRLLMAPVMWLAKVVLGACLRASGARLTRYRAHGAEVGVWDKPGYGVGPTGVLIHGLGGSSSEYLATINAMAKRCARVIAIDLPGHGASPAMGLNTPVGFDGEHTVAQQMAAAVGEALRRHLGGAPVHILGHSLGGFIAAQVVLERARQGHQSALLLVESDGAPWSEERRVSDRESFSVPTFAAARQVARDNYPAQPILAALLTPFLWARLASHQIQYLTHSDLKQPVLSRLELAALPAETTVVAGLQDKFMMEDDVHYFMQYLPKTASLLRPDTAHSDIIDAHPKLMPILDRFFKEG